MAPDGRVQSCTGTAEYWTAATVDRRAQTRQAWNTPRKDGQVRRTSHMVTMIDDDDDRNDGFTSDAHNAERRRMSP